MDRVLNLHPLALCVLDEDQARVVVRLNIFSDLGGLDLLRKSGEFFLSMKSGRDDESRDILRENLSVRQFAWCARAAGRGEQVAN
ncbi:hypothetical protein [Gluconobacter cerinus]|uniref:hypothetical protein n=1 Tax=Gluconobacter cerinus TaxID=38307 RepID=UPI001B8C084F|nr:hypothetical protein [Gluconobacter cerinus]MBS1042910.1 hypothetical protein [Gluconobacter cerinus]